MTDFLKLIMGDQTTGSFVAYIIFALIGIFIKLLWHVTQRNAASPNTPVDFSFKFLLSDNALRLIASFALSLFIVLIAIRFCDQILGVKLNPFVALFIGLGSDAISEKLKDFAARGVPFTTTQESIDTGGGASPQAVNTDQPAAAQTNTGGAPVIQLQQDAAVGGPPPVIQQ